MGTRTYSRRGVLTALGRRRAGLEAVDILNTPTLRSVDDSLADANWSFKLSNAIYEGEDLITETAATDSDMEYAFQKFGLDPQNVEHIEMMANILGAFGNNDADVIVRTSQNSTAADNFMSFIVATTVADSERTITIKDNEIVVRNMQFGKNYEGENIKGMGYAMLVRQIAGLRKLSAMMGGKPVRVVTEALSDGDTWNGANTWPRMGYNFDVRQDANLLDAVRRAGFTSTQTADLMTERNVAGELGFDKWEDIMKQAIEKSDIKITGAMTVTDDNDPGVQVLMRYGKNKGIVKSAPTPSGVLDLTSDDVARLRQAWLGEE